MNILEMATANQLRATGATKKVSITGQVNDQYTVYQIPLKYLYYNDQNGRINTAYKQYLAEHPSLIPEPGNSEYNKIFQNFIYNSNTQALSDTLVSIKEKSQQEPAVVLPDGRVIDGNRRFTALRCFENEDKIPKTLDAVIIPLDSKNDQKMIKELELDLQLAREEKVPYSPIDRIFDVYNTICITKIMNMEEYKKASGAGNTKGIKRDIRLAELVLKFIKIVSPGGNAIDKFYLARDLNLDGPIEEIEGTISRMDDSDKESITEGALVQLAVSKMGIYDLEPKLVMRSLKKNVLKNPNTLSHYLSAVDDKVDDIIDTFEEKPIKTAGDLKKAVRDSPELEKQVKRFKNATEKLIFKSKIDSKRKKVLAELENISESLGNIEPEAFYELNQDDFFTAKETLKQIHTILYKFGKVLK